MSKFNRIQSTFNYEIQQNEGSIVKFFNINNSYLTINIEPNDGYYELNIIYDRNPKVFDFPMLPIEMNKKINNYTKCYINLTLIINESVNFPFTAPIWSLKNIKYKFNYYIHIDIKEYYEYLINLHNENNKIWSPGGNQHIYSDLLKFIMISNTFDYL